MIKLQKTKEKKIWNHSGGWEGKEDNTYKVYHEKDNISWEIMVARK